MCVLCKHRDILCTTSKFRNLILIRHHFLIYLLHSVIVDCPLRPFYSIPFPRRRITHRIEMLLPAPLPEASPQSSWLREAGEEVHSPWRWMLFTSVHLYTELCHPPARALDASSLGPRVERGVTSQQGPQTRPSRSVLEAFALKRVFYLPSPIHTGRRDS